ncbi:TetR/AcrR family transcriptional regulator [Actinomycetospora termitidis]|uniref:Helix-turn-helix domain-containing protein n=1 Tax=Actinomycetospora termitidis TaxID=3053470 RepID=A0ABT7M5A9_9PSEU|nr:TetR/AcrR family transcriptional regulator [Actinomycetospora sp. Odt1-22]MDL5155636.1 helix-turn-helix domain-containing protein [Actinomycetospora sp. Odt1-22]
MAGLRAAQKEMTRRLLLTTALETFEAKGYAATTVDDIASAAGTTRVTFYAYFPSRSDLMRALIAELNGILERTASEQHGSTAHDLVTAVRDGSRDAIGAWLVERSKQWEAIRPYTVAAFEAAAVDPELRGLVDRWIEEVAGDVEEGLDAAGRFEPGTRHMRGVLAFAQLDHVARTWAHGRDREELDRMLDVLTESWWHLLSDED